ncbi:MAG: topoisomerase C-terminal repeat-containing protein [Myxococcales bacterium]|nr:topoisomerase C-terminal repeat-containing protein [Myxococcales bacterium]
MTKWLVISEKPSVAQDIVRVLGGFREQDGYWESDDWVVTYAVGHLFELLEPEELDEKYKAWTLEVLPILPDDRGFQLKPKKGQSERIRTIKKLALRDDVEGFVNACDAGREGELIFREIVKYLGSEKPIRRLWLQSMTTDAIRTGFEQLLPGEQLDGLAASAECRAYSDWLIGMNSTRALTKRLASRKEKTAWSAGRVQTPTLALLVDRELEVLAHVPKPYWRVKASFEHAGQTYEGTWFDPAFEADDDDARREDRLFDEARARAVAAEVASASARARETRKPSKESAPPLFDLTSLQREGNRRFGWSARRTLSAAQRCYERHKVLTYPRTDSRCLPEDYRDTVRGVLESYAGGGSGALAKRDTAFADYARAAARLLEDGLENEARTFDNKGVSDHFAIIPTGTLPEEELTGDDKRLFDLVVRRFFGAFHPPAEWERVERTTEAAGHAFTTRARSLEVPGWRAVLPPASEETEPAVSLAPLVAGATEASDVAVRTAASEVLEEETKPPPRITEARLLSLMENAGKQIDDDDIAAVLHQKGIGTPATRAEIIENLIRKGYVVRQGKSLRPTVKGIRLIDSLKRIHIDRLASPQLTGDLEYQLLEVERGERSARDFLAEVTQYAVDVVDRAKTFDYGELYADAESLGACPSCGRPVVESAWFYRCQPPLEEDDCPMRFWKDTSGRYLDPNAVRALCRDGVTPVLDGFTARNGRTYRGQIEVDRDEWKLVVRSIGWNEEATDDTPEYDVDERPLGPCPLGCGRDVVETPTEFTCAGRLEAERALAAIKAAEAEMSVDDRKKSIAARRKATREASDKPCTFVLPRTVCKREITRDEAQAYLANRRTELLTDFTSRFGRPFSATLVLQESGRHGFEFQPRGAAAKKTGEGDDAAAPDAAAPRKKAPAKKKAPGKKAPAKKAPGRKKPAKKAGRKKASAKKAGAKARARGGSPADAGDE